MFNEFEDSVIYHLIPRDYAKPGNKQKFSSLLERIKKHYEIEENFDIDSYYNVVPSCRHCNRQKSNKEIPLRDLIYLLKEAKNKYLKVEKKYLKMRRSRSKAELLAILSSSLEDGKITSEDMKALCPIQVDSPNKDLMFEIEYYTNDITVAIGIKKDVKPLFTTKFCLSNLACEPKLLFSPKEFTLIFELTTYATISFNLNNIMYLYSGTKLHENDIIFINNEMPTIGDLCLPN